MTKRIRSDLPIPVLCCIALWLVWATTATAVVTVANNVYEIHVQAQADGFQFGSWNAVTGAGHPAGPGRDVTYRGQNVTTNFSSLRIYRPGGTFADYTPGGAGGGMNLDPHLVSEGSSPQALATAGGQGRRTVWQIDSEGLRITQDVIVVGTDVDDSAIYHTVQIRNVGTEPARIGWRNLHDWSLTGAGTGPQDNPANRLESVCGAPFAGLTRNEFSHRPVAAGLVRVLLPTPASDYSPVLSLGFDPGFLPALPVTVPDEYAYVLWNRAVGTAFDDTIQGLTNIGDSAGLSWFGRDPGLARELGAGESVRFTQVLFAFEDEECPPEPTCAGVPWGLAGWWPFNEEDQGSAGGSFDDVARGHDGTARFPPAAIAGKVGRAASFDGGNDVIAVQDAPDLDLPAGVDLSIDFWIRTVDASGVSIVLEKRTSAPSVLGYQIFLDGGRVGLQLAEGTGSNFCSFDPNTSACTNYGSGVFIADGQWHLVAVTVARNDPQGGIWYVDGEEVGRFNPTVRDGSLENDGQLLIGAGDPDAPFAGDPFRGDLDELEIARRVLSPTEIAAIYQAGSKGKCSAYVDVPWDSPLCLDGDAVVPQVTVCNQGGQTGRFVFEFEGLPPNPPGVPHGNLCDAPGPSSFTVLGNAPLVVPPGECRTTRVRIADPATAASCYRVRATDVVTGLTKVDNGFIPVTNMVCCEPFDPVTPVRPGLGEPTSVVFRIEDTGLGTPDLDVRIEPFQGDETAPPALRLADAAPGAAIDRRVTFGPDGVATVDVPVTLTEDFSPLTFYDLVLSAELDGDAERELLASATVVPDGDPCVEGLNGLCLNQDRFRVAARWRTPQGEEGISQAVPLTSDTGFFWFFNDANLEMVVKVLDACNFNDRFWVFAGGLTNVEVELQVTDLLTGETKSYSNPLGEPFQPIQDTDAFATCDAGDGAMAFGDPAFGDPMLDDPRPRFAVPEAATLLPKVTELPLNDDRFVVEVEWETPDGDSGRGEGIPITSDTGYFWFFNEDNVELAVKVLDACRITDRFWVFSAGLTNVRVRLTVTDTATGASQTYLNPQGTRYQPIQDTDAFATCP